MNNIFITNHYRVLQELYKNTIIINGKRYCPLNQKEIAIKLNISRASINKLYSDLKNEGYIMMITRGKWTLSKEGYSFIEKTKKL